MRSIMVEIKEEKFELIILIGGIEAARYAFNPEQYHPHLYPLRAANGLSLLANSPTDHRNHHGIWIGHGRVNDSDFWQERHNSGKIVHQSFLNITSTSETASFTEENHWITHEGIHLLTDIRTFTFHDTPVQSRVFDLEITLKPASDKEVILHPTNEAGLPHIRIAESLSVKSGGTVTNASGKTNEKGTYRQNSEWLDSSGVLGRIQCGLAVFDHPENPSFPTPWFTRDYGPFSPNFGLFQEDPISITAISPLILRYRFYAHSGDVLEADVKGMWEQYAASVDESLEFSKIGSVHSERV